LVWLMLVASAFGTGWWFALTQVNHQDRIQLPETLSTDFGGALPVTAEPVGYRTVQRTVEAVGTLHGYEEVSLSTKVEGRVVKVHHDLSSRVHPGDLLIEIDTTDAKLAVAQAERNLQAELAKSGFTSVPSETEDLSNLPTVVSARLKYELARTQYERMQALRSTNSIAQEELEKSRSDTLVLEADWENQLLVAKSAAAMARLKNADLAIAQQRLADTRILAPVPTLYANESDQFYRVSQRLITEGTMLRVGSEVMKLVLGDTLKLRLAVPEAYGNTVQVGQKVDVMTAANDRSSQGTVARISPSVDRATRTFLVEVEVPNRDGALKPGGFAKANIHIAVNERATTIPLASLYSFAGINKLFLVENGVAQEIQVTIGEQTDNWVEITSPTLPADAIVITSGQRMLSQGKPVTIREPEADVGVDSNAPSEVSVPNSSDALSTAGPQP
jgi:RND family efflux transporter MFP subunit